MIKWFLLSHLKLRDQQRLRRVLPIAIERATSEIVPSIVQRSVTIAIQTTKELVIKDYALELDENRIYSAGHLMVGCLAGSLAHVTCKEPLQASLSSQLRNMLQGLNIANELLETAILNATKDNLDLGCAQIKNTATEKELLWVFSPKHFSLSLILCLCLGRGCMRILVVFLGKLSKQHQALMLCLLVLLLFLVSASLAHLIYPQDYLTLVYILLALETLDLVQLLNL